MSLPVTAKNDLDGYILDTEIVVKIPKGTEGYIAQEVRKDIVIVQFDVPSIPPLRVDRRELSIADTLDVIIEELNRIKTSKPFVEQDAHRAADTLLVRALSHLKTDENSAQINKITQIFEEIPKHYQ